MKAASLQHECVTQQMIPLRTLVADAAVLGCHSEAQRIASQMSWCVGHADAACDHHLKSASHRCSAQVGLAQHAVKANMLVNVARSREPLLGAS